MRDYITTLVFINHEVNPERLHYSPNFGFIKNKLVQMNPYYFITNSHCQSSLQIYVRGTLPFSKVQRQWDCKGLHFITCLWLRLPKTHQNPWFSFCQNGHNRAWSQFFPFYKKKQTKETRGTVFKLAALPVNNLSRMPYCEIISFNLS